MAEGIRIRHHTRRSQLVLVPVLTRRFDPPYTKCNRCSTPHMCKTYHIDVDDTGSAIVSTGVWQGMTEAPHLGGFRIVNPVAQPPTQTIKPAPITLRIEQHDPTTGNVLTVDQLIDQLQEHGLTVDEAVQSLLKRVIHQLAGGASDANSGAAREASGEDPSSQGCDGNQGEG